MLKLHPKVLAQLDGSVRAKLILLLRLQYLSTPKMAHVRQDTTAYREPKHRLDALQALSVTALELALKMSVLIALLVFTAKVTVIPL